VAGGGRDQQRPGVPCRDARWARLRRCLADDSAARIVQRYAKRVGLDPASYAGHSLRSGFLTSAAESGASIWKLSEVSRHKNLDTLRGYVRRVDLFKEHAGAAFL
jgi:site-specific recombinase XerD